MPAPMTPKQMGKYLRGQQSTALEKERPQQATVVHTTLWGASEGTLRCTLNSTGDTIWVEASGTMHEVAVDDVIYVERLGTGVRSRWRMVDFFKTSGGSHTPTLRQSITSKIHELWANDGSPQALDTDANGVMTALQNLLFDDGSGDSPVLQFIGGSNDDTISVFLDDDATAGDSDIVIKLCDASGDSKVLIRDSGDNDVFSIDSDGKLIALNKNLPLPLAIGGGTATIEAFNGAPSINLDADGETFFFSFPAPKEWDAASNIRLVFMVANEIAEDDGDDVSITCQVRGYADGEATSDAGQTVNCTLNLTGGDEAINIVNNVGGNIVYNDGTYPIATGDTVVVKATVDLGGAGECTGPLHIIAMWARYTADKWGA